MVRTLVAASSLLAGIGILLVGNGLLTTLLAIRASLEGFSELAIGFVMAAYFLGYLAGTVWCPRLIRQVGHIRSFATLAAVATACILAHALIITPVSWAVLRAVMGVCLVGIYISVESWLNSTATRENRGRVLAAYEGVALAALAGGQLLIIVSDLSQPAPFIGAAALFALGLVPVALTRLPEPAVPAAQKLSLLELYDISPLAVIGTLCGAVAQSALFAMGPLFAQGVGLSKTGVAVFMSVSIIGGAAFLWPIGHFSDRRDRRLVIAWTSLAGVLVAGFIAWAGGRSVPLLLACAFVSGGTIFVLYALCAAHANDLVRREDVLDAARGLNFAYALGAVAGPAVAGVSMQVLGPQGLFVLIAVALALLAALALGRSRVGTAVPLHAREAFVSLTQTSEAALEMHPHEPLEGGIAVDDDHPERGGTAPDPEVRPAANPDRDA